MRYKRGIHAPVIAKSVAKNRSDIHARGTTPKQEPRSPIISKIIARKHLARPTVSSTSQLFRFAYYSTMPSSVLQSPMSQVDEAPHKFENKN